MIRFYIGACLFIEMNGFEALREQAITDVRAHLFDNPCRGLVAGLTEEGKKVQISWIMGRSENSQNRVYVVEGDTMRTEAADPSKVKDPSLIIYNAMKTGGPFASGEKVFVVSNGDQTDSSIINIGKFRIGTDLGEALAGRFCEPDAPVFTPRITALQTSGSGNIIQLSVLRANPFARASWVEFAKGLDRKDFASDASYLNAVDTAAGVSRFKFPTSADTFTRTVQPGFGYMLTTYMPGSKELPSFKGEPILVPIIGSLEVAMEHFYAWLEPAWRVAVGGREMDRNGSVRYAEPINRLEKVETGK